jgi:lysophospholipase L1-like esterase
MSFRARHPRGSRLGGGHILGRAVVVGVALIGAGLSGSAGAATAVCTQQQPNVQRRPQQQQPLPPKRPLKIVVVGDSYSSGEGIRGTYFDPRDPRHQSRVSAAAQAAAKLQAANPQVQVELHVTASSGATTSDVFLTQRNDAPTGQRPQDPLDPSTWHDPDDLAVNLPQIEQIPADADAVIVGLGGNDALFGPLSRAFVLEQWTRSYELRGEDLALLNDSFSDQAYLDQARLNPKGYAPTLVARLLQVLQATRDRAPNAKLFVQNYPIAIDPQKGSSTDLLSHDALEAMKRLGISINTAIERAVDICKCATLVDVSTALAGRELNTAAPAVNSVWFGVRGDRGKMKMSEPFHPNSAGAALMSDDIAYTFAEQLGVEHPDRYGDRVYDTGNITIINSPAPGTICAGRPDRTTPAPAPEPPVIPQGTPMRQPSIPSAPGNEPQIGPPSITPPAPGGRPGAGSPVIPPSAPMRQPYQPSVPVPPLRPPLFPVQPPTPPPLTPPLGGGGPRRTPPQPAPPPPPPPPPPESFTGV